MRRWNSVALFLVVPFFGPSLVTAQVPSAKPDAATNAAVQYWQAFALMPALDKEQEKLLEQWNTAPLDSAAQKLIAASENSLMYLRRAAKLDHCDWGLDYNDGISLILPHLAKSRDLARLAALHARREFAQGHWNVGQADANAMMVLARHVGRDPIMVNVLVRFTIEGTVVELVAPYVPELKIPYSKAVPMFATLPQAATLQQAVLTEKKFMAEWMITKLKDEERRKKGSGVELWKKMLDGPEVPEALKQIKTTEEVIKLTEDVVPVYEQLAKFVSLPKSEFDAQYPIFMQKTNTANPLAGVLLPHMEKVLAKEHRNQARLAMLMAAIAVTEGGPEKLKDIKDPFGTGPFGYRALDKGFELKSALLYDNQPVTLKVGR